MKTFTQYLDEMTHAAYGDYTKNVSQYLQDVSRFIINKKWTRLTTINGLELYRLTERNKRNYLIGKFNTQKDGSPFEVYTRMTLEVDSESSQLFNKIFYNVNLVATQSGMQGSGLAKSLYQYLVEVEDLLILGDAVQYFGARRLWSKISKMSTVVVVDILDIANGEVIERDVTLSHGDLDHEFDPRVWSDDHLTYHIRPLLQKLI